MKNEVADFRGALNTFGTVYAYENAMKHGLAPGIVAGMQQMPPRRSAMFGLGQVGAEPQTRVLFGRGGEFPVAYIGNQPAAVASMAFKGMVPNVATVGNGLHA